MWCTIFDAAVRRLRGELAEAQYHGIARRVIDQAVNQQASTPSERALLTSALWAAAANMAAADTITEIHEYAEPFAARDGGMMVLQSDFILYQDDRLRITRNDVDRAVLAATERLRPLIEADVGEGDGVTFHPDEGRLRNQDGRLIREDWLRSWGRQSIAARFEVVRRLAERVYDQDRMAAQQSEINVAAWKEEMRQAIKDEHIRQYLSTKPRDAMTQADWGRIGGLLNEQYRYLDGFANDVAAGRLTEAQIEARSRMYMRSARQGFETANREIKQDAGYTEVRWVVNHALENCPDCLRWGRQGWQRIEDNPYNGCVPGQGCTICLCITTPWSRVLTRNGWKPMWHVAVGDLVLTHRGIFEPVTGVSVKPSYGRQEGFIRGPTGRWVGCTTDHLWYTANGWVPLGDIGNTPLWMYNGVTSTTGENHGEMSQMRSDDEKSYRFMQGMSECMRMRGFKGFSGEAMQAMCGEYQGREAMGKPGNTRQNDGRITQISPGASDHIRGFVSRYSMATARGRTLLDLVLDWRQEAYDLPLSVGLGVSQRPDSRRGGYPPQEWRCNRRPYRELRADGFIERPHAISRRARPGLGPLAASPSARMDMQNMRRNVPTILAQTRRRLSRADILLAGLLAPGQAIYDLEVAGAHSFVIEGLAAHNTNCGCHLEYRGGEWTLSTGRNPNRPSSDSEDES